LAAEYKASIGLETVGEGRFFPAWAGSWGEFEREIKTASLVKFYELGKVLLLMGFAFLIIN